MTRRRRCGVSKGFIAENTGKGSMVKGSMIKAWRAGIDHIAIGGRAARLNDAVARQESIEAEGRRASIVGNALISHIVASGAAANGSLSRLMRIAYYF
jgi:hypothetical protein